MGPLTWEQLHSCAGPWPFDDRGLPGVVDPDVKVKRELVFLGTDEKGINVVTQTPSTTIKVKVNGNYRIVHRQPYSGGDVFDAPDDDQTKQWIRAGWVTPVPAKKEKSANGTSNRTG
jgi:hypothetical protein